MNTYIFGDLQGCADEFQKLLDSVSFDPGRDQCWLVGDLINRGPDSLRCLRLARELGPACIAILGNHDLSALAQLAAPVPQDLKKTAKEIAAAPDGQELFDWLRERPLCHQDRGLFMVHAGLPPQWSTEQALTEAEAVEEQLRGPHYQALFASMFGNQPRRWSENLSGQDRLRFAINCFTRMRFCRPDGELEFEHKLAPGTAPAGYQPWFSLPDRKSANRTIVFGHWSTLGQVYWPRYRVWGLDTGCVWGGSLTALHWERRRLIHAPAQRKL